MVIQDPHRIAIVFASRICIIQATIYILWSLHVYEMYTKHNYANCTKMLVYLSAGHTMAPADPKSFVK